MSSLVPASLPFAVPEAGFDYFATQAHFRSLASRIITALGGFNVIVVTEDRLSSGPTLATALDEAAAGRYTVIGYPNGPELGRRDLLSCHRALSASPAADSLLSGEPVSPAVIVFDNPGLFSNKEIEEIFQHVHQRSRIGDHRIAAAVFLAPTEFLYRLEQPVFRAWLAKRLLVARLRLHELGADEIFAFIHHQLPSREAEQIITDEAIAAIANVSGGDPVVVNRFSRRMLDCAAASTGNMLEKDNLGSATVMSPDMPLEKRGISTVTERLRQNYTAPESDAQLSSRIWRDRSRRLKVIAGITFCFASVGVATVVADIAASRTAPATDTSAKLPEQRSLTGWAPPDPKMAPTAEEPTAVPGNAARTAMTAPAAPTLANALAIKTPALPQSMAPLRPTAELAMANRAAETVVNAAGPPAAPTEVAPTATTVSPTGMQEPTSTPSTPDLQPAQLRLPAAEIAALLARGDALLARGDIASARLFYERAADAGEGLAALKLGNTFDPVFLEFAHVRTQGDSAMAESWYRRARELGETEAEILLTAAYRHDQDEATAAQHNIVPGERR